MLTSNMNTRKPESPLHQALASIPVQFRKKLIDARNTCISNRPPHDKYGHKPGYQGAAPTAIPLALHGGG
jgi:hypothetical protein